MDYHEELEKEVRLGTRGELDAMYALVWLYFQRYTGIQIMDVYVCADSQSFCDAG